MVMQAQRKNITYDIVPAESGCIVTRRSSMSGKVGSMGLPLQADDVKARVERWANSSALIQDVFPDLDAEERKFMLSGITPEEWRQAFGEEE